MAGFFIGGCMYPEHNQEIVVPLTDFQKSIMAMAIQRPGPGKHAARSAIRHLNRAWLLKDADREMALFRTITALEESSTAIFHAVKRRRYEGAAKLRVRCHKHKSAVKPFCAAIGKLLNHLVHDGYEPTLEIDNVDSPRELKVRITVVDQHNEKKFAYPQPPLGVAISDKSGKALMFEKQLSELAEGIGEKEIVGHIEKIANFRNRLLYASEKGVPAVEEAVEERLLQSRDDVFSQLALFVLVDQSPEKQLLVQQSVFAFLKMFKLIEEQELSL